MYYKRVIWAICDHILDGLRSARPRQSGMFVHVLIVNVANERKTKVHNFFSDENSDVYIWPILI